MPTPAMAPVLLTAAFGWIYYRRIRGSFGRQPWRPVRTGLRIGVLAVAGLLMASAAVFVPGASLPVAAGATVGLLLGLLALRHTRAGWHLGQRCYTPNPWIGAALSVLLVARLAWRMGSGVIGGGSAQFAQQASPLTLGLGATLIAYYLAQGIGLWLLMRKLEIPEETGATV